MYIYRKDMSLRWTLTYYRLLSSGLLLSSFQLHVFMFRGRHLNSVVHSVYCVAAHPLGTMFEHKTRPPWKWAISPSPGLVRPIIVAFFWGMQRIMEHLGPRLLPRIAHRGMYRAIGKPSTWAHHSCYYYYYYYSALCLVACLLSNRKVNYKVNESKRRKQNKSIIIT